MSSDIDYKIYHYCCDDVDDSSWGCVWRNLQTIIDSLKLTVPTMKELAVFFDKEKYFKKITSGNKDIALTTLWLEPYQAGKYLQHIHDINVAHFLWIKNDSSLSNIMTSPLEIYLSNPEDCIYNPSREKEFKNIIINYLKKYKYPILIDNGTFSYLISGYVTADNNISLIRIDPHQKELKKTISLIDFNNFFNSDLWMIMLVMPKKIKKKIILDT